MLRAALGLSVLLLSSAVYAQEDKDGIRRPERLTVGVADQLLGQLSPDHKTLTRVVSDFKRPNGIIGTPDGKTLYISDIDGHKTWSYSIQEDGSLKDKKLLCNLGSDGMTIDDAGNVYLTGRGVTAFDPTGKQVLHIDVAQPWTANICFAGKGSHTLFITASKATRRPRSSGRSMRARISCDATENSDEASVPVNSTDKSRAARRGARPAGSEAAIRKLCPARTDGNGGRGT